MSINHVAISGNLTRDPELRSTSSGTDVLSFSVAVNDRRKNSATGEWEDCPNFIDCTMFGTRATSLVNILTKGMKVAVDGKLRYSSWEDQETGKKRSKLEIIPNDVDIMQRNQNHASEPISEPQGAVYEVQAPPKPQQANQYQAPQFTEVQGNRFMPPADVQQRLAQQQQQQTSVYDQDIPV